MLRTVGSEYDDRIAFIQVIDGCLVWNYELMAGSFGLKVVSNMQ